MEFKSKTYIIDTCIPKTIVKDIATPPWIDSEIRHVGYRNGRKRHGVVLRHQTQKVAGKNSESAEINQIY